MPSSVKDRFKNAWESVFFFSKNKKYYFDLDAVRVPTITPTKPFNARVRDSKKQRYLQKATDEEIKNHNGKGEKDGVKIDNPKGKNPSDVFRINTKPFKEAHFATFPPALPQKILKCACPNQVCNKCGKPRYPISKPTEAYQKIIDQKSWSSQDTLKLGNALTTTKNKSVSAEYEITGYTDCGCNAGFKRGIVLDPFFGSGTVGLVAEQMGLQWCGIELNPEYIEIAKKRLDPFTSVEKMEAFV